MKKTLNKVFKKSNIEVVFVAMVVLLIVEYLIFPGLTSTNTLANIASSLGAILLGLFVYYYIFPDKPKEDIQPGETELDYIPKEEVIKKKRNSKQFPEIKSEQPFVKTRKKPNTNTTQKVMGEYQVNNSEKVRKSLIKKTK
jgi:hypothetical protein